VTAWNNKMRKKDELLKNRQNRSDSVQRASFDRRLESIWFDGKQ
jgi:hypothetical protein